MKKIFILFALALLFFSCNNDNNDTNWKVINLEVSSSDWTVSTDANGLNRYYYCYFDMPEISDAIFNYGTVLAYYTLDNTQQILPYVRHYENAQGALWTRTVDFDYSPGGINFYVTNSDFYDEVPPTMNFRVVLMW
jgi:hypothetical protein